VALDFNGSNQRLIRVGGGVGGTLAYFAWSWPDSTGLTQRTIVREYLSSTDTMRMYHYSNRNYISYIRGAVSIFIFLAGAGSGVWGGAATSHVSTGAGATNVWVGGAKNSGQFNSNTSANQELIIGANGFGNYYDGKLSHVGQWDLGLTDAEHIGLSRGVSPRRTRPNNLAAYWELTGNYSPEVDFINKKWLTLNNGPTKYPERPVFRPLGVINVGLSGGGPVTPGRNVLPLCPCCGYQGTNGQGGD
jgi:hypothetical protein